MKLRALIMAASAVLLFNAGILYAANGDLIVNGNLGVGTSAPASKAEVNGNMVVDGNLGVGTSTPAQKLSVAGTIQSTTGGVMFPDGSTQTTAVQFPGVVTMFGGATIPGGWLLCDGSAVSRTTYATLFAVIGTTYGAGDGSTTFNLPDFRGIFPKGAGTTSRVLGQDASGNFYSGVLGQYKQDQLQGHKHSYRDPNTGGFYGAGASGAMVPSTNYTGVPSTDGTNGTPRTGHTTEPQSLGVNFIIKY
jgi:microcystin-dependent protein